MGGVRARLIRATTAPWPIEDSKGRIDTLANRLPGASTRPLSFRKRRKRVHPEPLNSAAIAGACTTALKACFDETFVIPDPVVVSADGTSLVPWRGALLTVGGELNKLASNVTLGRDAAAVHSRADRVEALELGEAVATGILRELRRTTPETFAGVSFTRFDGGKTRP